MDWWWKLFQGNSDIMIDSCTYMYIYIQVSVRDITLECLQITSTKFRGSTFLKFNRAIIHVIPEYEQLTFRSRLGWKCKKNQDSIFVKSMRNHMTVIICLFSVYSVYSVYDLTLNIINKFCWIINPLLFSD
jgi:hypothetical protein